MPASSPATTALDARLTAPAAWTGAAELLRHWRRTEVRVLAPRPPGLDDGFGLAGRVRGAVGHALAAQVDPASSRRPSAVDILFCDRADWVPGLRTPKPCALAVDTSGQDLTLRLSLFGFAGAWAADVAEGMARALRTGIRLTPTSPVFARPHPYDVTITRHESVPSPRLVGSEVALVFRTPVTVRQGQDLLADGPRLISGLVHRLAGLARWHDLGLTGDPAMWGDMARALDYGVEDLRFVSWPRWSSRQPGRTIPMRGLLGTLWIRGDLDPILPLLALGETAHAGGGAIFGLGRYELAGCLPQEETPDIVATPSP